MNDIDDFHTQSLYGNRKVNSLAGYIMISCWYSLLSFEFGSKEIIVFDDIS